MTTETFDIVVNERGASSAAKSIEGIANSADRTERAVESANKKLSLMDSGAARLKASFAGIPGALTTVGTAIGAAFSLTKVIEYADSFTNIQNQLKRTTKDQTSLKASMDEVFKISQDTRSSFEGNVGTYTRLQQSLTGMGKQAKEAGPLLTTINQAMAVSGTSAEAAKAGMLQFQQALQGGVLRGEEFNSITENTPGLLTAIAVGMNKPIGALRQMAEQGQLTSKTIVEALSKAAPAVAASFAQVTTTVSSALTVLNNAFIRFLGEEKQGLVRKMAEGLLYLAANLNTIIPYATAAGLAIGGILALQFTVWIGGVVIGLATMTAGFVSLAASATLAAAPFIAIAAVIATVAAGAVWLASKFYDLTAVWESFKASVTGIVTKMMEYVGVSDKAADGTKKTSGAGKTLDEIMNSLNKSLGGTVTSANGASSGVKNLGDSFSYAAEKGSALEKQLGEVFAMEERNRNAAKQAADERKARIDAWTAETSKAKDFGIQASGAFNAASIAASGLSGSIDNIGTSFDNASDKMQKFQGISNSIEPTGGAVGSSTSRTRTDGTTENGMVISTRPQYYGVGAPEGWVLNEFGNYVEPLTTAIESNTKATVDLNKQLSPQGYDPTKMGRVFVPTGGGFVREEQGAYGGGAGSGSGGSGSTPYGPLRDPDSVPYRGGGARTINQTVIIKTDNVDSFRRSRRQVAADARRALGG